MSMCSAVAYVYEQSRRREQTTDTHIPRTHTAGRLQVCGRLTAYCVYALETCRSIGLLAVGHKELNWKKRAQSIYCGPPNRGQRQRRSLRGHSRVPLQQWNSIKAGVCSLEIWWWVLQS